MPPPEAAQGLNETNGTRYISPVQAVPPRGPEAVPQGRALPDRQVRRRAPLVPAGRARPRPPEAVRVPRPAAREAEGAPVLRGPREAVPDVLRQGVPSARHHGREPAAHPRVPLRQRPRAPG